MIQNLIPADTGRPGVVVGEPALAQTESGDAIEWLAEFWDALSERERDVLWRRANGTTLDAIGNDLGLTRERVRQLQKNAEQALATTASTHLDFLDRIADSLAQEMAVDSQRLFAALPSAPREAQATLLNVVGVRHPRTWDGDLLTWWCDSPESLDRNLHAIVALAPLSHENFAAAMEQVGLRMVPPVLDLLTSPNSKLIRHDLGWIRPSRANRDLAFLWLEEQGTPRSAADISAVTGNSERAIRETMRRDEAFSQVRPEGTWALTAWRTPGADSQYANAVDAVIDVLRDMGPLELGELRAETLRRYPVSSWRVSQCLSSSSIGRLPDGRYDLAERGAVPVEDAEPNQPSNIHVSGNTVGVRLDVNHDLLRGSGIAVNRWLTWYLGLRIVPSLRNFELVNPPGTLTVKRGSSNSQISSLRTAVLSLDLAEGCRIALVLNTQHHTARLHHACSPTRCPAKSVG